MLVLGVFYLVLKSFWIQWWFMFYSRYMKLKNPRYKQALWVPSRCWSHENFFLLANISEAYCRLTRIILLKINLLCSALVCSAVLLAQSDLLSCSWPLLCIFMSDGLYNILGYILFPLCSFIDITYSFLLLFVFFFMKTVFSYLQWIILGSAAINQFPSQGLLNSDSI